jgi:hypothetical protein
MRCHYSGSMIFDFLILATRFQTSIVNSVSAVKLWIISQLIPSGICSIKSWNAGPDSVAVLHCAPFPCGHCFPQPIFCIFRSYRSTSIRLQKGKRKRSMTAWRQGCALLYHITCKTNAATRLSIPTTTRANGYGCQGHGSNHCPAGVPRVLQK